jgi:uncharacterized spore protein YtfJ
MVDAGQTGVIAGITGCTCVLEVEMTEGTPSERTVMDVLRRVVDGASVRTVFGEPVTRDGVTVVPVARIRGTGGAGGGDAPAPDAKQAGGSGAGLVVSARPLGAYVVRDGKVTWRPAVDVNRIVLGGQVVGVVALLTAGTVLRRWLATTEHRHGRRGRHGGPLRAALGAAGRRRHEGH